MARWSIYGQSQTRRVEEEAQAGAEQAPTATEARSPASLRREQRWTRSSVHDERDSRPRHVHQPAAGVPAGQPPAPLARQLAQKTLQQAASTRESPAPPALPAAPVHYRAHPPRSSPRTRAPTTTPSPDPRGHPHRRHPAPVLPTSGAPAAEPDEAEAEDIQPSIERPSRGTIYSNPPI